MLGSGQSLAYWVTSGGMADTAGVVGAGVVVVGVGIEVVVVGAGTVVVAVAVVVLVVVTVEVTVVVVVQAAVASKIVMSASARNHLGLILITFFINSPLQ